MSVKQVVATGFIIFRSLNQQIEYLLLQASDDTHHWTPPKGHVDPGETELETAYRETLEEAGLTNKHLDIVNGFEKVLHYEVRGKPKKVVYWLAKLRDPDTPIVLSSEHQCYRWLDLDAAVELSRYDDMQQTMREADNFLRNCDKELK